MCRCRSSCDDKHRGGKAAPAPPRPHPLRRLRRGAPRGLLRAARFRLRLPGAEHPVGYRLQLLPSHSVGRPARLLRGRAPTGRRRRLRRMPCAVRARRVDRPARRVHDHVEEVCRMPFGARGGGGRHQAVARSDDTGELSLLPRRHGGQRRLRYDRGSRGCSRSPAPLRGDRRRPRWGCLRRRLGRPDVPRRRQPDVHGLPQPPRHRPRRAVQGRPQARSRRQPGARHLAPPQEEPYRGRLTRAAVRFGLVPRLSRGALVGRSRAQPPRRQPRVARGPVRLLQRGDTRLGRPHRRHGPGPAGRSPLPRLGPSASRGGELR